MTNAELNEQLEKLANQIDRILQEHDPYIDAPLPPETWDALKKLVDAVDVLGDLMSTPPR